MRTWWAAWLSGITAGPGQLETLEYRFYKTLVTVDSFAGTPWGGIAEAVAYALYADKHYSETASTCDVWAVAGPAPYERFDGRFVIEFPFVQDPEHDNHLHETGSTFLPGTEDLDPLEGHEYTVNDGQVRYRNPSTCYAVPTLSALAPFRIGTTWPEGDTALFHFGTQQAIEAVYVHIDDVDYFQSPRLQRDHTQLPCGQP